jgi:hypothetical protein
MEAWRGATNLGLGFHEGSSLEDGGRERVRMRKMRDFSSKIVYIH